MEIYQFWSNFDGKMGVSAGEMRVLVQFLDVFCGKIVVFDGETRILVQFWMENGCNLPTPPAVSSRNRLVSCKFSVVSWAPAKTVRLKLGQFTKL